MTKLENIEERLKKRAINVSDFAISPNKKAMSHLVGRTRSIALNRNTLHGKADETSVLAEELGHFETNSLYSISSAYNTPIIKANRKKREAQGKQWAYREYCSPCEIEEAYKREGLYGDYAVAEYCSITVEFLHKAIEYHRSCGVVFSFDNENY